MKKNIFVFLIFFLFSLSVFAQVSVSPQEEFYSDAVNWYQKGYVERLPQLKPYPLNIVKNMLETVIQLGESAEQARASAYYKEFFGKSWNVSASGAYYGKIYSLENTENEVAERFENFNQATGNLNFSSAFLLKDFVGFNFSSELHGQSSFTNSSDVIPRYMANSNLSVIEPFIFEAGDIDLLMNLSGNVSVGSKNLYGTFGFNPIGYGLFPDDDLILSPCSNQILNATFNYEGKSFQYAQVFGLTGASNKYKGNETDFSFDKFFAFHSINVPFFNGKLNIAYFEGAVFGGGFNPSFLTPVPWAIVSLADGNSETVFAGTKIEVKPMQCLSWNTEFLLNDLKPKNFIKLKWNDAAIRSAFKTGFTYTPLDSIASLISVDYTLVTPYTFTAYDTIDEKYNYRDYSNFGAPIGTDLLPNSDRVSMTLNFKPTKNLKISTVSAYSRHGNQYEDWEYEDILKLDGTAYTNTTLAQNTQNLDSAKDQTGFLIQDNLMYTMQAGIDIEYTFYSKKYSKVSFGLGYTFEFIKNDGVDDGIYTGNYTDLSYSTDEEKKATEEKLDAEKENWQKHLHNSYNHYFRAGVKITF